MIIKQISVFLENRPGTLAEVLGVLGEHDINLRAMAVADTADFGILRLVVNEPDKVERVLRGANFAVKTTPVLAIKVSDQPGGLLTEIKRLTAAGINIEYVYAFATAASDEARVVLKVDDLKKAEEVLREESPNQDGLGDGPNFYW
ncbi:MAG: ACT domain-containing protein [Negativicutes bacterium]|nr:ACT domain-containing protein [Negativicutes bacterium]